MHASVDENFQDNNNEQERKFKQDTDILVESF